MQRYWMQRYCLLTFAVLLLVLPGCLTPASRLYGTWQSEGALAMIGTKVEFKTDGTAVVTSGFGEIVYQWEVTKAEGDNLEVLWTNKTDTSQVAVTGTLVFTGPDNIQVEVPGTPVSLRLSRVKPKE